MDAKKALKRRAKSNQSALNGRAPIGNCWFHQLKNATTLGAALIACLGRA
jgi:hypothetical protein